MRGPPADIESALDQVSRFQNPFRVNYPNHNIDGVLLEAFKLAKLSDWDQHAIHVERVKTLALRPSGHIRVKTFSRFDQRRQHPQRPTARRPFEFFDDRGDALLFHRQIAVRTKLGSGFSKK